MHPFHHRPVLGLLLLGLILVVPLNPLFANQNESKKVINQLEIEKKNAAMQLGKFINAALLSWGPFVLGFGFIAWLIHYLNWCCEKTSTKLKRPPLGYPEAKEHQVTFGQFDHPTDFVWDFPYLIVDGTRYDFEFSSRIKGKPKSYKLEGGAEVNFVKKEAVTRKPK